MKPKRVEVLIIGDELLDGRVADTNTLRLAEALSEFNIQVTQRTTILDDTPTIVKEAKSINARGTDLCIVSGGLGPTSDDLTALAFANLGNVQLERDTETAQKIKERLIEHKRPVTENQLKQADRPVSSQILKNSVGTAPGFSFRYQDCLFMAFPGVPKEFDFMIEEHILKPLRQEALPSLKKKSFRSFGLFEAQVDDLLSGLPNKFPSIRLGYRAHFPEIIITLKASPQDEQTLEEASEFVREQLGPSLFSEEEGPFAKGLIESLINSKETLSIAESCTGGFIGHLITEVPGSSQAFNLGVTTYSNESKIKLLGVKEETLSKHGAVSEATVIEMAEGIRKLSQATYGLSVSGIAGPDGGTPDKPVGTIFIALSKEDKTETKKLSLLFGREKNKILSAFSALDLLRRRHHYPRGNS
ncbi:MAG: damage-inducible protein CinA [Halobacteriovoraceae bacterium]|nr:damage-inducible protein CinA [Halobacteriovoraceae bacterium]